MSVGLLAHPREIISSWLLPAMSRHLDRERFVKLQALFFVGLVDMLTENMSQLLA